MPFPRLFEPLRLRGHVLAGRVVFCAHLTNQAVDRRLTPAHTAYYAARAAGGAALVVTEELSVSADDRPYEKVVDGTDPAVVAGCRAIADAVHGHGGLVVAQLGHNGGQGSSLLSRVPLLAPSPVADALFREVPREATDADLAAVVAGFELVAGHVVAGGMDGVELQASQSSLLRAFLSPAANRRTDRWGGPVEQRARLLLDVVAAVRGVLGPDRLLGVRLAAAEPGGTTTEDAVAVAGLLAATGDVDWLSTTVGVATESLYLVEPSMATPAGYALPLAARIRAAVDLPVVGVGRVTTPEQAEAALERGDCDLVGVVRGQVADPDFVAKVRRGEPVRPCVGCNGECAARVGANRWLGCLQEPRTGRESVPLPVPTRPRSVVVVGAGLAGLRTAAAAARRGHRVCLLEAADEVGGQLRDAVRAPGRGELWGLVTAAVADCDRAGVTVRTGCRVDGVPTDADVVVLATGARPARPDWAGDDARVADVRAVLDRSVTPSGSVLVVDELGGPHAPSTAEALAAAGCTVEVVTGALVSAQDLGPTLDRELWHRRAAVAGIAQTVERVVLGVRARSDGRRVVRLLHHLTGVEETRVVDWVVTAVPPTPDDALWAQLAASGLEVHRVGDVLAPRTAVAASVEADRVAGEL
ncbi:FAD-dependent oxidoreductase [Modestobacter sp. Leaf380]|uniref:oxidoreductase n=1 Tax=Modestobacter sp. Leaf380 TaxID=1736356 RepID=UPI0006F3E6BA|nr:FAD-dependent oxidoreductase [Modestobacter sp. Leaf380]KQS66631.1 2,4-dienoyl-CoA reductase [Modestobacter sp. Leaf380]